MISFKVSLEEIGVSTILQYITEEHARKVRQALRMAHAKEDDKKHFFMDTLINITSAPCAEANISTLGLSSQVKPNYSFRSKKKQSYQKTTIENHTKVRIIKTFNSIPRELRNYQFKIFEEFK